MQLRVAQGKVLTVVCIFATNSSFDYQAFLKSLGGVLVRFPPGAITGLCSSAGGLGKLTCVQQQRNLGGHDYEEQSP